MNYKKATFTAIAVGLLLLLSGPPIFEKIMDKPSTAEIDSPNSGVNILSIIDLSAQTLTGQQMSYSFPLTKASPQWSIHIRNTSTFSYTATITKVSPAVLCNGLELF